MKGTIDANIPNAKEKILNNKKELAKEIYANISTSNPKSKYMDIGVSDNLTLPKPMYGHFIRLKISDKNIGEFSGKPYAVSDGNNSSYVMFLSGKSEDGQQIDGNSYRGLSLETQTALPQGNISLCGKTDMRYSSISPPTSVNATPEWVFVMPFEIAVTIAAIAIYRRIS
jgi:hypothetical protein